MKSVKDIINRVKELDTSLAWVENGNVHKLVSSKSNRILADVRQVEDSYICSIGRSYRNDGETFLTLESAKIWVKFVVIKSRLSEECREATIQ